MNIKEILRFPAVQAAPLLIGWVLCRQLSQGVVKLKIVETEAYNQDDPASHSYKRQTARTAPMFQAGGHLYIYFTYGAHYCVNIVTGPKDTGEAVLLRSAEPIKGIKIMQATRGKLDLKNLASGPGKLAQAIGINDTSLSGKLLNKSSIWLESPEQPVKASDIIAAPRIGISQAKDVPWRFYLKDNLFVSKL